MALEAALKDMKNLGALAAAIASRDGSVLAADVPPEVSKETFSIMCATILGAGTTASIEFRRTGPQRIMLESDDGRILIAEAGRRALIALVLPMSADIDHVVRQLKPIEERVARETR